MLEEENKLLKTIFSGSTARGSTLKFKFILVKFENERHFINKTDSREVLYYYLFSLVINVTWYFISYFVFNQNEARNKFVFLPL